MSEFPAPYTTGKAYENVSLDIVRDESDAVPGVEIAGSHASNSNTPGTTNVESFFDANGELIVHKRTADDMLQVVVKRRLDLPPSLPLAESYFVHRDGEIKIALDKCCTVIDNGTDGRMVQYWVLSEIDHWDQEHEKIVLLCERSILNVYYNFIARRLRSFRRIPLNTLDSVTVGSYIYPARAMWQERGHGGIKLSWAHGQQLSIWQRWNPLAELNYLQLSDHPLFYRDPNFSNPRVFDVRDFLHELIKTLQALRSSDHQFATSNFEYHESGLLIESYASANAAIYNQSMLGFAKERGGISY